jgi:RNA polymerase sigma factor (sigma-70 family)
MITIAVTSPHSVKTWICPNCDCGRREENGSDACPRCGAEMVLCNVMPAEVPIDAQGLSYVADGRNEVRAADMRELAAVAMRSLSPREKKVVHLRFWGGLALEEIGEEMDMSYQRVQQILDKAMKKMQTCLRFRGERDDYFA